MAISDSDWAAYLKYLESIPPEVRQQMAEKSAAEAKAIYNDFAKCFASGVCDSCGKVASLWRLALAPGYDKRESAPKYYCMECSKKRTDELRRKGIKIRGKSR